MPDAQDRCILLEHPLCTFSIMTEGDRAEVAALVSDAHVRLSPLVRALEVSRAEVEEVLTRFIMGLDRTTCVVAHEPVANTLVFCTVLMPMFRLEELTFGGVLSPMDDLDDVVFAGCPGRPEEVLLGDLASIHSAFQGRGIGKLGAEVHVQRARALGFRYAGGVAIHPANDRIWRSVGAQEYGSARVCDFEFRLSDGQKTRPFATLEQKTALLLVDTHAE